MSEEQQHGETRKLTGQRPGQEKWSRRAERIAAIMLPSFIAAVMATMLFFTFIDPEFLGLALAYERELSAMTATSSCFFFFWFIGLVSSGTTMFLRRTRRRRGGVDKNEPRGSQPDNYNK